jgi:hypothetical protein
MARLKAMLSATTMTRYVEENYSLWLYWEKLFNIAIGVARGLEYLHGEGSAMGHLNVKPRNVLLDQELSKGI